MQISALTGTPTVVALSHSVSSVAPVASEPEMSTDGVSLSGNYALEEPVAKASPDSSTACSAMPRAEGEVNDALATILSQNSAEQVASDVEVASSTVEPARSQAPSLEDGFLLADGSVATGQAVTSSQVSFGSMPTMEDLRDYAFLSYPEAEANYNENVRDNLGVTERLTIKAYSTFAYKMMNDYMLGKTGSPTGVVKGATNCLSEALSRFEVPSGCMLHRNSTFEELRNYLSDEDFAKYSKYRKRSTDQLAKILDNSLTGTQVKRKGCISTTLAPSYESMIRPKVETRFYVGENVKGVFLGADERLDKRLRSGENEYLLAPDTKTTVLGVKYNPSVKGLVINVFLGDLPEKKA